MLPPHTLHCIDTTRPWHYDPCAVIHRFRDQYISGLSLKQTADLAGGKRGASCLKDHFCSHLLGTESFEPVSIFQSRLFLTTELLTFVFYQARQDYRLVKIAVKPSFI